MTPTLARLQRLAEAQAHRRILLAFRAVREMVPTDRLARILRDGGDVIVALPLEVLTARLRTELGRILRNVYEASGDYAAGRVKRQLVGKDVSFTTQVEEWAFDVVNDRGLRALQERGAALVVEITEETRRALREVLAEMMTQGVPVTTQAKRVKELVGLTTPHARAVENLRAELTDRGIAPARVEQLAARKAKELLDLRALNIARTETMTALAAGQRESWEQAKDEGLFEAAEAMQAWSTSQDDATCPECGPMDGQQVKYGEAFTTGEGDQVYDPPIHPGCRCVCDLVL